MSSRVLVVDDDDVGRATMADILRLEGYQVDEAGGGREALARLARDAYDVVLLDLKMPGVDGVAVLQGAAEVAPETQVVVFTAHGSMESAIQAVRHGAYDYLLKPASAADVVACIARAAARRQARSRERRLVQSSEAALAELRGADGDGREALLSLPGVTGVEDRGACSYLVEHAPGSDPREAIFRLAVARGWVLITMTATQASLEDVFVRLTTREEPPAAMEV